MRKMFSEKQIQKIVNDKIVDGVDSGIIDGDLSVGGDLIADTISQANANYSSEFEYSGTHDTYFDITNVYNRFEVINNVLYIVFNIKLMNNTESSHSTTTSGKYSNQIDLPEEIATKIFDIDGHNIWNESSANRGIMVTNGVWARVSGDGNIGAAEGLCYVRLMKYDNLNGRIIVQFNTPSGISISAGAGLYLQARFFLTLI